MNGQVNGQANGQANPPERTRPDSQTTLPPPPSQPDRVSSRVRLGALYRWGFFAGLGVLSSVAVALVVYSVRDILLRVLVAAFLAVSLDPAVRWLQGRGVRRGLAVGIIFTIFLAIIVGFLMSVI